MCRSNVWNVVDIRFLAYLTVAVEKKVVLFLSIIVLCYILSMCISFFVLDNIFPI